VSIIYTTYCLKYFSGSGEYVTKCKVCNILHVAVWCSSVASSQYWTSKRMVHVEQWL